MADELQGRRVAILAADGVERVELEQPRQALDEAGADTTLLSIHEGEIQARNYDIEAAGTFAVDGLVSEASVDDYDALLLPGGTVNPDQLRINDDAVGFVRDWFATGKPVGVICHGPWTLITAGVAEGRRLTSWPSVRVAWPDLWVPLDRREALAVLVAAHARALRGDRVEVTCRGGLGRTGTALGALAVLDGLPADDAVRWVRSHYHPRAVETPWQRRWVRSVVSTKASGGPASDT